MNNLLTQKFPIAAFVLLFVLTLSCSHEPTVEPQEPGGTNVAEWNDSAFNGDAVMNQMTFCIGDGVTVKRDAATRATTDIDGVADFETGDLVAVAVTQGTSAEEIKLYRVKSDGSLEYAGGDNNPLIWKSATNPATIRAWSYGTSTNLLYTLDAPESFDYSLTSNQQTNGYNELLYSKEAAISYATYSSSPIPLTFRHQLSRLVVNIEHDSPTSLAGTVSMGDNVNNTFPITARFDTIGGGSWTHTAYGAITPKGETAQSGYEATYSAVVFPGTYAQNTKMFTLTNTDGDYVYAVSDASGQTLTAGNQYNYTITVKDDITKNPLWWVAQYNLAQGGTSFVSAHSHTGQYLISYTDALSANVAGYHQPIRNEQLSIMPIIGPGMSLGAITNPLNNPYEYSEIACNVGGITVAGSTSIFGMHATGDYYAIRFINTSYTSAWHYKYQTSPCNGILIESYLISGVTTLAQAKNVMKDLASSPTFVGSVNAGTANQTPESTTMTSKCYVQRFLPLCGHRTGSGGTGQQRAGLLGYYWSSTAMGYYRAFRWGAGDNGSMGTDNEAQSYGFSVRLFKDGICAGTALASSSVGDIICSHGKAHAPTTGALSCGGDKIAIVAYRGNGEANTLFNNGLAIAMEDVSGTPQWFTANNGTCVAQSSNVSNLITNYRGIEYTVLLANGQCGSGHVHAAAQAALNYEYTVPRPSGTSQWFLPTIGQWNLIAKGMCEQSVDVQGEVSNNNFAEAAFNTKILAAGGIGVAGAYASSVERSADQAWRMHFSVGMFSSQYKSSIYHYVRPVLAF